MFKLLNTNFKQGGVGVESKNSCINIMSNLLNKETEIITVFEFSVGDNHYGINAEYILEILEYKGSTLVPNTPEGIEGIFVLRGNVIINLNMFKCLNVDFTNESKKTKNIIVDFRKLNIGLIVSSVNGIHKVPSSSVVEISEEDGNNLAIGTIKQNNKLITLLDIEKVIFSVNDSI